MLIARRATMLPPSMRRATPRFMSSATRADATFDIGSRDVVEMFTPRLMLSPRGCRDVIYTGAPAARRALSAKIYGNKSITRGTGAERYMRDE